MNHANSGVTDAEILAEFSGTNFGDINPRQLLALSVLKVALGYHCGYTIMQIMDRMRLVKNGQVLNRGRNFCYDQLGGCRGG